MSHRDKDCPTRSETSAQALIEIVESLWPTSVAEAIKLSSRKDCQWSAQGLVFAALAWAWSGRETLGDRLTQAIDVAQAQTRAVAPKTISYQGFIKLLTHHTARLATALKEAFRQRMLEFDNARIGGFTIFAIDGTKLSTPRTESNEGAFSPRKTRKKGQKGKARKRRPKSKRDRAQRACEKKADSPQASLTLVFHAALCLPWAWRWGPSDAGERNHARDMFGELPDDALLVADCGFCGYEFWSDMLARKLSFVIRVGGNVRLLRRLGDVRERGEFVYLWPQSFADRKHPPLKLRRVVIHDGRRSWHLVTNVLDENRLSDAEIAIIYGMRWRVEVFFRGLKRTFGREKLRSHKAEHLACEGEWSLLGLWALLLYARLQRGANSPLRTSLARVLRIIRRLLDAPDRLQTPENSAANRIGAATIDRYSRREKRSRSYPRKKYESAARPPRVRVATSPERLAAMVVLNGQAA